MIDFNNRFNGNPNGRLPAKSSAAPSKPANMLSESLEQTGQIISVLRTDQLSKLTPHPASQIFPICELEIQRMMESLRLNGQQHPIILLGADRQLVLDGNCRVAAAKRMQMPLAAIWADDEIFEGLPPEVWVIRRNRSIHDGRHLNETQLALIAVRAENAIARREAKCRKSKGVPAGAFKGEVHELIARKYHLPANRCRQAMKIVTEMDLHIFSLVYNGTLSISKGAAIAKLPEAKRNDAIARALSKKHRAPNDPTSWPEAQESLRRYLKSLEKSAAALSNLAQKVRAFDVEHAAHLENVHKNLMNAIKDVSNVIADSNEKDSSPSSGKP